MRTEKQETLSGVWHSIAYSTLDSKCMVACSINQKK